MTRKRWIASAMAGCSLLAACGSSGGGSGSVSGGGGGDEAGKSADQILADAVDALKSAKSFHISGHSQSGSGDVDLDLVAPNSAAGTISQDGVPFHFVYLGGKAYAQGREFWAKFAPQAVDVVGDHWVLLPSTAAGGFSQFADFNVFTTCLAQDHGTLSKGGTTTVDGQSAIVLMDAGDKPGTAAGKLYIAADGTPYPLKLEVTGSASASPSAVASPAAGGATCSSSSGGGGTLIFSKFDSAASVTPPPDPLDFSKLGGG